jgi:hypothetical protein
LRSNSPASSKEERNAAIDKVADRRIDEIGSVTLLPASDAASLSAGSIVLADGGYSCW